MRQPTELPSRTLARVLYSAIAATLAFAVAAEVLSISVAGPLALTMVACGREGAEEPAVVETPLGTLPASTDDMPPDFPRS